MTLSEIISQINNHAPTAWDGFQVYNNKQGKLILKGTPDFIYESMQMFVMFTGVEVKPVFEQNFYDHYHLKTTISLSLLEQSHELRTIEVKASGGYTFQVRCKKLYYAYLLESTTQELTEVVDYCFELKDESPQ